jgi:hypothetical protein
MAWSALASRLPVALTAVFRNQLAQLIAALARAFAAFDAQHIELAFDVAEDEVSSVPRAYSITSSARKRIAVGMSMPRALAAFRLTANSTLVGCCTGKSPGFSPLRIRPA